MASDLNIVEFIVEQMADAGEITFKLMFGDYGVFCEGKIVALICDNKLFVKQTEAGREFIGDIKEAPPYPGAKPSLLIEEQIEDRQWLGKLIQLTFNELPEPKPKRKRKPKKR
jgi:TfoX/Sxy family transcriptional regulator of competence genes